MSFTLTEVKHPRLINISIARLNPIPHGVRKTNGISIHALAASIRAEGLLQNLTVVPDSTAPLAGAEEFQNYQVIAGCRRLKALKHLIDAKALPDDYEVPCLVIDESAALSASLAENAIREPMHPADEFTAFREMIDAGKSIEDVAARFGVTPLVVQRMLKLANVAPKIFEQFRQDKVTLEQMMALAISDDHKAQEKALFKPRHTWETNAHALRNALTNKEIDMLRDPVARFVGLKEYELAGGVVRRDLFGKEGAGFITDRNLLQKLATEKLRIVADQVTKEGWSFVLIVDHIELSELSEYSRAEPAGKHKVGDIEKKQIKELTAERNAAEKRLRDLNVDDSTDHDDEKAQLRDRCRAIGDEIQALVDARMFYDPKILAKGGAIVTIENGAIKVHRGLVKGKLRQAKDAKSSKGAVGEAPAQQPGHSEALTRELTAHATFAIAAEMVGSDAGRGIAIIALTHRLLLSQFYVGDGGISTVCIKHDSNYPAKLLQSIRAEGLGGTIATSPDLAVLATERKAIKALLPGKSRELLGWLLEPAQSKLISRLLAYCVAESIDAVDGTGADGKAGPSAAPLAAALKIDMRKRWTAKRDTYLTRVNAATILSALQDVGADKATLGKSEKLKKSELIDLAQPLLATWLPKVLRFGGK